MGAAHRVTFLWHPEIVTERSSTLMLSIVYERLGALSSRTGGITLCPCRATPLHCNSDTSLCHSPITQCVVAVVVSFYRNVFRSEVP